MHSLRGLPAAARAFPRWELVRLLVVTVIDFIFVLPMLAAQTELKNRSTFYERRPNRELNDLRSGPLPDVLLDHWPHRELKLVREIATWRFSELSAYCMRHFNR